MMSSTNLYYLECILTFKGNRVYRVHSYCDIREICKNFNLKQKQLVKKDAKRISNRYIKELYDLL